MISKYNYGIKHYPFISISKFPNAEGTWMKGFWQCSASWVILMTMSKQIYRYSILLEVIAMSLDYGHLPYIILPLLIYKTTTQAPII